MLYLEDFLELIEQLPAELRDRCTEMRMLDLQVQRGSDQISKETKELFDQASSMSQEEQNRRYAKIKEDYKKIRELTDEKVLIAETMYNLMEKYSQKLNKEILHFKYELEADNPGITEQIEKKFIETERALMMQRKERKKRVHEVSQSSTSALNGNISIIKAETPTPTPSRSSAPRTSICGSLAEGGHQEGTMSSHSSRTCFIQFDEDSRSAGNHDARTTTSSSVGVADRDPDLPPLKVTVKRSATNPNKLIAITNVSSPAVSSLSPACSEKGNERWMTPSASSTPPVHSPIAVVSKPHPVHIAGVTGAPASSSAVSSPTVAPGTMLTFTGPESRHGRPRKLTSRVQEMIKDTIQRHERRVPSHHSPEHEEESEGDDSDRDNDKRTWCICNEKSYGYMVACDNKLCPFEWFHYECVNLTQPPKGKWFCPHCTETKGRSASLERT